jgi:hypothetical protein
MGSPLRTDIQFQHPIGFAGQNRIAAARSKSARMSNVSLRFDETGEAPLRTGIMIAVGFLSRSD